MFVLVCFSCVVSFHIKEFICISLLRCCCFFVTRLSGLLVCILWSFFLVCFCCFVLNSVFFSCLSKKTPQKNRTQQKPKKATMQKNRQKKVSAVVFTNSVLQFFGVGLKFSFLLKHYKNSGFGIFQTGNNSQKLAKMLSQNLVQG